MPAVAGSFFPLRSTCAVPFTVLISPTSCARTPVDRTIAATAIIQRIAVSLLSFITPAASYNAPGLRVGKKRGICLARTIYDDSRPPRADAGFAWIFRGFLRFRGHPPGAI